LCKECHGFCNEVLRKMRLGFDDDEDENYEVLVSWLVVDPIVSICLNLSLYLYCVRWWELGSGRSGLYWPFSTVKSLLFL
jgi:hypothetical protein